MTDSRLVETWRDAEAETRTHRSWGALGPDDSWVRTTFTTESGARNYVRRNPDHVLVSQTLTTVTKVSRSDWEVEA